MPISPISRQTEVPTPRAGEARSQDPESRPRSTVLPEHTRLSALYGMRLGQRQLPPRMRPRRRLSFDSRNAAWELSRNGWGSAEQITERLNYERSVYAHYGVESALPRRYLVQNVSNYSVDDVRANLLQITPFTAGRNGKMRLQTKGQSRMRCEVDAESYFGMIQAVLGSALVAPNDRPTLAELGSRFEICGSNHFTARIILRYANVMRHIPGTYEYELQSVNVSQGPIPAFRPFRGTSDSDYRNGLMKISEMGRTRGWVTESQYKALVDFGRENMGMDPAERLSANEIGKRMNMDPSLVRSTLAVLNLNYPHVDRPAQVELANT